MSLHDYAIRILTVRSVRPLLPSVKFRIYYGYKTAALRTFHRFLCVAKFGSAAVKAAAQNAYFREAG